MQPRLDRRSGTQGGEGGPPREVENDLAPKRGHHEKPRGGRTYCFERAGLTYPWLHIVRRPAPPVNEKAARQHFATAGRRSPHECRVRLAPRPYGQEPRLPRRASRVAEAVPSP